MIFFREWISCFGSCTYYSIRPTDVTIYFNKILSKQRYLTFFFLFFIFFVSHMASSERRIPSYNASFFDAWYISEPPREFQILRTFRPEYLNNPLGNPEIYSSITKNACGIPLVFVFRTMPYARQKK